MINTQKTATEKVLTTIGASTQSINNTNDLNEREAKSHLISSGINSVVKQEDIPTDDEVCLDFETTTTVGLNSSDAKTQSLASNKGIKTEEVKNDDEGINPYELDTDNDDLNDYNLA